MRFARERQEMTKPADVSIRVQALSFAIDASRHRAPLAKDLVADAATIESYLRDGKAGWEVLAGNAANALLASWQPVARPPRARVSKAPTKKPARKSRAA